MSHYENAEEALKDLPSLVTDIRLVEALEAIYPDRLPRDVIPATELAALIERQNIIRLLRTACTRRSEPSEGGDSLDQEYPL